MGNGTRLTRQVRCLRKTSLPLPCLLVTFATLATLGCRDEETAGWTPPPAPAAGKPEPTSPDRLPPGELMEGPDEVFGFHIPKGMTRLSRLGRTERLIGHVDFDQLTDYVRARIVARHAEMLNGALVFPVARIKGVPDKLFEFSIREEKAGRLLEITDKTPRPATHGLSEEKRWEKAGLKPNGDLIDPNGME